MEPCTIVSPGANWEVACSEATVWKLLLPVRLISNSAVQPTAACPSPVLCTTADQFPQFSCAQETSTWSTCRLHTESVGIGSGVAVRITGRGVDVAGPRVGAGVRALVGACSLARAGGAG